MIILQRKRKEDSADLAARTGEPVKWREADLGDREAAGQAPD